MSESKKLVQMYEVDYMCDVCGIGRVLPTSLSFATYPPKFPHECNHCHDKYTFNFTYPLKKYGLSNAN